MDVKAYLPKNDFSLTTTKLIELHKYADSKATSVKDEVVARVNAAMLMVFALGDVVVHAAVAVAKTAIAAVELPLYIAGTGADFNGTAAEVWCHTTHSIRSALTIFGSLAGLAKPEWTLHVYDWVALDVTAPKGLLAGPAQQIRQAVHNAWKSPRRNLVIGCAVTAAFVALGYVYLAPPKVPTDNNVGGSTPTNGNSGELQTSGWNMFIPLAFSGLEVIGATLWWATRRSQKNSGTIADSSHVKVDNSTALVPTEDSLATSVTKGAKEEDDSKSHKTAASPQTPTSFVFSSHLMAPPERPVHTGTPQPRSSTIGHSSMPRRASFTYGERLQEGPDSGQWPLTTARPGWLKGFTTKLASSSPPSRAPSPTGFTDDEEPTAGQELQGQTGSGLQVPNDKNCKVISSDEEDDEEDDECSLDSDGEGDSLGSHTPPNSFPSTESQIVDWMVRLRPPPRVSPNKEHPRPQDLSARLADD